MKTKTTRIAAPLCCSTVVIKKTIDEEKKQRTERERREINWSMKT